jgi:hypothetical protein
MTRPSHLLLCALLGACAAPGERRTPAEVPDPGCASCDTEACRAACAPSDTPDTVLVPTILGVRPRKGPSAGGMLLQIGGQGFVDGPALRVTIGGVVAGGVRFESDHLITATLPALPGAYGMFDVSVRGGDGREDSAPQAFRYYFGALDFAAPLDVDAGVRSGSVAFADLDGDGREDLIALAPDQGEVALRLRLPGGGFGPARSFPACALPAGLAVTDFNGDDRVDVALGCGDGSIRVLDGNGDGTLSGAAAYSVAAPPAALLAADLDGDGSPDLAAAGGGRDVSVLLGRGDGTFHLGRGYPAGTAPAGLAAADAGGDGVLDLVAAGDGLVTVLTGAGDGTFAQPASYPGGLGLSAVSAADLDGDGYPDLVLGDRVAGGVAVLRGAGDGTFGAAQVYPIGPTGSVPEALVVADLDLDGLPDVIAADRGAVAVLRGEGRGGLGAPRRFPAPAEPRALALSAADRDGQRDLVVVVAAQGPLGLLRSAFR